MEESSLTLSQLNTPTSKTVLTLAGAMCSWWVANYLIIHIQMFNIKELVPYNHQNFLKNLFGNTNVK